MSSTSVPEIRNDIVLSDTGQNTTAATRTVRAVSWVDAARLQCWIAGRGEQVVPAHCVGNILNVGQVSEFRYRVRPRFQTTRYAYSFVLTGASASDAEVVIPAGGTAYRVPIRTIADARPTTIYVDRTAQDDAEAELSFSIEPDKIDLRVDCVSIESVPRATVDVSNADLGADRLSVWVRQPIAEPSIHGQMLARQADLRDSARRGLLQISRGTVGPWSTTSGTASSIISQSLPVIPRHLYGLGGTARSMAIRVLAQCSDSQTAGEVQVETPFTSTATIAIPTGTTSWTWLPATTGAPLSFAFKTEDPATAGGLLGGWSDYMLDVRIRRTTQSGTVRVATVSVFEVP